MSYRTAALAAALLLVPGIAAADVNPQADRGARAEQRVQHRFDQLDRDHDGKVTAAEIEAFRAEHFAAIDRNGDGAVDRDEFAAMIEQKRQERAARWFERLDADKDGRIEAAELDRPTAGLIQRLDADKDGVLTMDEMRAARQHRHHKKRAHD